MTPRSLVIQPVHVKPPLALLVILVATLAGACRQPDGVTPVLDAENADRIRDLGRDLALVATGDASAHQDFADDLVVFVDPHAPGVQTAVHDFALHLAGAVALAKLTDQAAQQIARTSWVVIGSTEQSDRQIRAVQAELRSQLAAVGIPQDRVDAVVAEVPTVQRAVTTRPRRWYEVL